jgi:acyl-CoA hydrolase
MSRRIAGGPAQTISAEQAASFVRSGMWLDYGVALCQPDVFDKALAARREGLENVKIRSCLSMKPRAVVEDDPAGQHFLWFSWHFSGYDRKKHDAGRCNYMPLNLGEVPDYYRRFLDPVDIVVLKTCPMDEDGYFNFSAANIWHRAVIERAKMVVVEVTQSLPYAYGDENGVHVSEVDYLVEGDNEPAPELLNPPPNEVDRAVARRIAAEIEDGSCLQVGIGGMPNAVCTLLLESGVRDLGVHTEMLTDGIAELYRTGRITGSRKTLAPARLSTPLR